MNAYTENACLAPSPLKNISGMYVVQYICIIVPDNVNLPKCGSFSVEPINYLKQFDFFFFQCLPFLFVSL